MSTRAAAAREAAFIASSLNSNRQDLSNLQTPPQKIEKQLVKKRKFAAAKQNSSIANEGVKGGWDELPHNMGKVNGSIAEINGQRLSPVETLVSPSSKTARKGHVSVYSSKGATSPKTKDEKIGKGLNPGLLSHVSHTKKNGPRPMKTDPNGGVEIDKVENAIKQESADDQEENNFPQLSKKEEINATTNGVETTFEEGYEDHKRRKYGVPKKMIHNSSEVQQKGDEAVRSGENIPKKVKKGKANPYGLSPGESPFPDFPMPTAEACKEVQDLLSEVHGLVEPPKTIPAPSLEVTGCGEVPSVLDALIRTRLSAATTSTNSGYAFAGLVEKYGIREEGIGQGSVDWNKVRDSDVLDLEKAIKRGGLAKSKSISIMKILDMVHEQNILRGNAFVKERETGEAPDVIGADRMERGHKDMEIAVVERNILSLDYMHGLTPDEAMTEFTKYPGIGVKTASCVILFCLRRPSFAVDTHVWRFCKWLKWVPEGATRDQTFSHCEVRVPDDMKYSLHQLFIRHGRTCGRCRAATGEASDGWASIVCPIEKLVKRTGKRKGFLPMKVSSAGRTGKKGKKTDDWEGDIEADDSTEAEEEEEPKLSDDWED